MDNNIGGAMFDNGMFEYAWIMMLIIMPINAVYYRYNGRKYIAEDASLEKGYNKIAFSLGVLGEIPFIFLSYDFYTNGFNFSVFSIHTILESNALIAMHLSAVILCSLLCYWMFFKNGAEYMVRHPGLYREGLSKDSERNIGPNGYKIVSVLALGIQFTPWINGYL